MTELFKFEYGSGQVYLKLVHSSRDMNEWLARRLSLMPTGSENSNDIVQISLRGHKAESCNGR